MDLNITGLHDSEIGQIAARVRGLDDATLVQLGARAVLGLDAPSVAVMALPAVAEKPKRGRKVKSMKDLAGPPKKAKATKAKPTRAPRVSKDSPELAEAADKIVDQLERHEQSGQKVNEIVDAIGMDKKMCTKALLMLKASGRIRVVGQKRATRYFPK